MGIEQNREIEANSAHVRGCLGVQIRLASGKEVYKTQRLTVDSEISKEENTGMGYSFVFEKKAAFELFL